MGRSQLAPRPRGAGQRMAARRSGSRALIPAALPFFDISIAALQSLDELRETVREEAVLASALHAPATRVLACQVSTFGSPFG